MAFLELPENPNLENLKKQAKALLKAVRANDARALARVGPYFGNPAAIGLQYAQLVIAREYGFSSWKVLRDAVVGTAGAEQAKADRTANQFLDLVCLAYQAEAAPGQHRFAQAAELLEAHPEIREENIYTAAAMGDVGRVERWLRQDPELVHAKGGYFNWEPLMYAAYGRPPGASTFKVGECLLAHGADPNAHYMWGGQYKFTALTGVFGQGEGGPTDFPEHPDTVAFARALLQAGADPNDSQAAYNRCFEPDNTCLELLLEFGLNGRDRNNWFLEEGDQLLPNSSETMHFQLIIALRRGYTQRAKLLIDHGVDLNKPDDTYDTLIKGRTPYEAARLLGLEEIAEYLLAKGARKTDLSEVDLFHAACMRADRSGARALAEAHSDLGELIKPRAREMLCDAVMHNNVGALALMIELGFALNYPSARSPLHDAALNGRLEMARMLLEAGADSTLRDPVYGAGPLGFALHAGQQEMARMLDEYPMDIFAAATRGNLVQLRAQLEKEPTAHTLRFQDVRPPEVGPQANDWMPPLASAVLSGQVGAVELLLDYGADPEFDDGAGTTVRDLARDSENAAILSAFDATTDESG